MASEQLAADLQLIDDLGQVVAVLRIYARNADSIVALPEAEAREHGEEPLQITEGHSYEYAASQPLPAGTRIRETRLVQPSRVSDVAGRIEPGLHPGLLVIDLEDAAETVVARGRIEVRSAKIGYRDEYRTMLSDIADHAIGLVTDLRAPALTRLAHDEALDPATLHQRFAFIRSVLEAGRLQSAVARIAASPDRRWVPEEEPRDVRRGFRAGRATMRTMASSQNRLHIPEAHPARGLMERRGVQVPTLPRQVPGARTVATLDTPANRFAKFALLDIAQFLADVEARLVAVGRSDDRRLLGACRHLMREVEHAVRLPVFADVGMATVLPLGSPVLQRKAGYRELLSIWIRFRLASSLAWDGGEDVFGAGKRDVAQLYEYWLFFLLLDLFRNEVLADPPPLHDLVALTADGFDLRLAAGSAFSIAGRVSGCERPLRARFSYNRMFSGQPLDLPSKVRQAGSWTRPMRPDFTISFWPEECSEAEAERHDLMVHVHFDAKYRAETISGLFGVDDALEDLEDVDRATSVNAAPKRSDLLKMHAYRDAIRRTHGAYVLYPGAGRDSSQWREYHEILPGLGAFAVRPSDVDRGARAIAIFLRDVCSHLCAEMERSAPAAGSHAATG